MFDFFKPKVKAIKFPKEEILPRYYKMRTWSLSGVFIGYGILSCAKQYHSFNSIYTKST
ncbi:hypothetical protein ACXR4C_000303 [Campylobacter jejuni]